MANHSELFGTDKSESTLLVFFIPSVDRLGASIDQDTWVTGALEFRSRRSEMAKNVQKVAEAMGAKVVGRVPDVGGGAFGAARLATLLQRRLEPGRGQRPGRPTDSTWTRHPKVPMSEDVERKLIALAREVSTPQRRVSPMQVAAQLLEDAVLHVDVTQSSS